MNVFRIGALIALCLAIIVVSVQPMEAARSDKKSTLTFSDPVRLPGKVTLPAGTYVFRLVDTNPNRSIIRITNEDRSMTYATILGINDYRPTASTRAVMTFGETASCQPHTIKAWYYAGDTSGVRFVYTTEEAEALAKGCAEPVPYVAPTVLATVKATPVVVPAPVKVATPEEQEVEYSRVEFEPSDVDDQTGYDAEPEPAPAAMPQTASQLPLLGLLGLMLLAIGFSSRLILRRIS